MFLSRRTVKFHMVEKGQIRDTYTDNAETGPVDGVGCRKLYGTMERGVRIEETWHVCLPTTRLSSLVGAFDFVEHKVATLAWLETALIFFYFAMA